MRKIRFVLLLILCVLTFGFVFSSVRRFRSTVSSGGSGGSSPSVETAAPSCEHDWDEDFFVLREPNLIRDGEKVDHCLICGSARVVVFPLELEVADSMDLSSSSFTSNQNQDFVLSKNISEIRGDRSFAPSASDPDGNDLWFEYSFLWNDSLYYRDVPSYYGEIDLFSFRGSNNIEFGFYYLYVRDNGDGLSTSSECPFQGHIDFSKYYRGCDPDYTCVVDLSSEGNTLNGSPIGRYIAGWGAGRGDSPYLYDSVMQPSGGWHRLGFHYHQEARIENGVVRYEGFTELFIDGVKCWKVLTNMEGTYSNGTWSDTSQSLKTKNVLLWTAEIDPEDNSKLVYTHNDNLLVQMCISKLSMSSQNVYVAIDDPIWTCGDGFVRNVFRVDNPISSPFELVEGVQTEGKIFFDYQ